MRTSIRHPASFPVEIYAGRQRQQVSGLLYDISLGGLALKAGLPFKKGMRIRLRITLLEPPFETPAKVVWCCGQNSSFRVGVRFISSKDATRMRALDQLCQIERYRQEIFQRESRILSPEAAAREWLEQGQQWSAEGWSQGSGPARKPRA